MNGFIQMYKNILGKITFRCVSNDRPMSYEPTNNGAHFLMTQKFPNEPRIPAFTTHTDRVLHNFLLSLARIEDIGVINSIKREVNLIAEKHAIMEIYRMEDEFVVATAFFAFVIGWNNLGAQYVDKFEKV